MTAVALIVRKLMILNVHVLGSVGSLGRYNDEQDVQGLVVKDTTLTGTMFGVRIKTWENSPKRISARNLTFQNIVMRDVANPIYIDQYYCPYASCSNKVSFQRAQCSQIEFLLINMLGSDNRLIGCYIYMQSPSLVRISDIHFRNIRGTSSTPTAVTLKCSHGLPCQNVNLQDVNLRYTGREPSSSTCMNVKARYRGKQIPPPCH